VVSVSYIEISARKFISDRSSIHALFLYRMYSEVLKIGHVFVTIVGFVWFWIRVDKKINEASDDDDNEFDNEQVGWN